MRRGTGLGSVSWGTWSSDSRAALPQEDGEALGTERTGRPSARHYFRRATRDPDKPSAAGATLRRMEIWLLGRHRWSRWPFRSRGTMQPWAPIKTCNRSSNGSLWTAAAIQPEMGRIGGDCFQKCGCFGAGEETARAGWRPAWARPRRPIVGEAAVEKRALPRVAGGTNTGGGTRRVCWDGLRLRSCGG